MIEMNVAGIALDASSRIPIVLLKDSTERRALPIWIGQHEAKAILSALDEHKPIRPMTHDLIFDCLEVWDVEVDKIVIHALQDSTFYASIFLKQGKTVKQVDARPSDAIALAIRADAPIWVVEEVIADASIPVDQEADEEEREEFKRFVDQIRPKDFQTSLGDSEPSNESN